MPAIHLRKKYRSPSVLSQDNKLVKGTRKQTLLVDVNQGVHEFVPGITRVNEDRKIVHTKAGDVVFDHGLAVMENDERAQDAYDEMRERDPDLPDRYAIIRGREGMYRDRVHKFFFGSWPEMPWKVNKNG